MKIDFVAQKVRFNEALGGDIVEVVFDEDPRGNKLYPEKCYLLISQNYEFSSKPDLQWFDGKELDGCSQILRYTLTENLLVLEINELLTFRIQHESDKETLRQIQDFFRHEFGGD